jgi:hypothetical protein
MGHHEDQKSQESGARPYLGIDGSMAIGAIDKHPLPQLDFPHFRLPDIESARLD